MKNLKNHFFLVILLCIFTFLIISCENNEETTNTNNPPPDTGNPPPNTVNPTTDTISSNINSWPVVAQNIVPLNQLGLFPDVDNSNSDFCYKRETSQDRVTSALCDLFDRNQWFYATTDISGNVTKHFATNTICVDCDAPFIPLILSEIYSASIFSGTTTTFDNLMLSESNVTNEIDMTLDSSNHNQRMTITILLTPQSKIEIIRYALFNNSLEVCSNNFSALNRPIAIIEERNIDGKIGQYIIANTTCSTNSNNIKILLSLKQVEKLIPNQFSILELTVSSDSNVIASASGIYTEEAGINLLNFILEKPQVKTIRFIDLPGSADDISLAYYARFIRSAGLNTYLPVNGEAYSGGVDIFLAGNRRTVESGGILGVHSWSGGGVAGGDLATNDMRHNRYINYANEMLGSPTGRNFYFFTLEGDGSGDGTGICAMSDEQIRQYITPNILSTPAGTTTARQNNTSTPECR